MGNSSFTHTQGHNTDQRTNHHLRQSTIHGPGLFSPVQTTWGHKREVYHPNPSHAPHSSGRHAHVEKKERIDWAAINKTTHWEPCTSPDEIADRQLLSSTDEHAMGRPKGSLNTPDGATEFV